MVIISVPTHMQMEESHTQRAQIQYQGIHPQSDHAAGNFLSQSLAALYLSTDLERIKL